MKTFSAKPLEVKREWYVVDATDKVVGRLAAEIALRLRGKDKPEYTPHVDTGDYIIVVNADKLVMTGAKAEDKKEDEKEENEGNWMRREYGYASFQRMFQLPENADPEHIDASMKNGVLKIKVGKIKGKEENKKTIEIK